jgi:recombination protein RecT
MATPNTSNGLTREQRFYNLQDQLKKHSSTIRTILPKGVDCDRFMRIGLNDVRKVPQLLLCDPRSFVLALMHCAELGLEPGGALGDVYLVPFANEVKIIVGYQGLTKLAYQSGLIGHISASAVLDGDTFDWNDGDKPFVMHKQRLVLANGTPGGFLAAFSVIRLKGAEWPLVRVMDAHKIEKIRYNTRKHGIEGPWADHFDEMAIKTVLRNGLKQAPKSTQLAGAMDLDERAERGERPDYSGLMDSSQAANELVQQQDEWTQKAQAEVQPQGESQGAGPTGQIEGEPQRMDLRAEPRQNVVVDPLKADLQQRTRRRAAPRPEMIPGQGEVVPAAVAQTAQPTQGASGAGAQTYTMGTPPGPTAQPPGPTGTQGPSQPTGQLPLGAQGREPGQDG